MLQETPAPALETARLRRILETQPCSLMRVGLDGALLAANDAALQLLGTGERGRVLGQLFPERVIPEDRDGWTAFVSRVQAGESASMACDLEGLDGERRRVSLQAVPLEHEDGVPSMILTARDQPPAAPAPPIALAVAPQPDAAPQLERLRSERDYAIAEGQRLENLLSEREANHASASGRLEQALADERSLTSLLRSRQERGQGELEALRTEIAQLRASERQLAAHADARVTNEAGRVAELEAARAGLQDVVSALETQAEALRQELESAHEERRALQAQLALAAQDAQSRPSEAGRVADLEAARCELQESVGALEAQAAALREELESAHDERRALESHLAVVEQEARRRVTEEEGERAKLQMTLIERDEVASALRDELVAERDEWLQVRSSLEERERAEAAARTELEQRSVEYQSALQRQTEEQKEELERFRAEREQDLAALTTRQERTAKALADALVELQALDECVRAAESLASAGRLARLLAPELHTMLSGIDGRAARVLGQTPLNAAERQELEALRREAVKAAVLASQIASTGQLAAGASTDTRPAPSASDDTAKGQG